MGAGAYRVGVLTNPTPSQMFADPIGAVSMTRPLIGLARTRSTHIAHTRTGSHMICSKSASRFLIAASALALVACADSPNPLQPPSSASLASGVAQDRP